jgi:hypothetical protein
MMTLFIWGALAMASFVAMLFFIRYWQRSHDRLFFMFALAFCALAVNWIGLAMAYPSRESAHSMYVVRLIAFLLIASGIVDKNRRG